MKRTFCDRCEVQCINTTVIIRAGAIHHTSDGTYVAEDEYKPIELCRNCMNELREIIPQAFVLQHHSEHNAEDMAREAPVPERPLM